MMFDRTQNSKGDNSPNISIDSVYLNTPSDQQSTIGREITTMAQLVRYLSDNSDSLTYQPDTDYKKAFQEKLSAYPTIEQIMNDEFINLSTIYKQPYDQGWIAEDVGETMKTKIALFLRAKSIDLLDNQHLDPNAVISKMCEDLHAAFTTNDFDESAIRFFVLSQFLECNVLPVRST